MCAAVSMIAGTTTIVRSAAGMPLRRSIFGSCRGGTCEVMARFNRLIASSLTGSRVTAATRSSSGQVAPCRDAYDTKLRRISAMLSAIVPR